MKMLQGSSLLPDDNKIDININEAESVHNHSHSSSRYSNRSGLGVKNKYKSRKK
jgi:hypothetical protein